MYAVLQALSAFSQLKSNLCRYFPTSKIQNVLQFTCFSASLSLLACLQVEFFLPPILSSNKYIRNFKSKFSFCNDLILLMSSLTENDDDGIDEDEHSDPAYDDTDPDLCLRVDDDGGTPKVSTE